MSYHIDYNYTDKSIVIFGVPKEEAEIFKKSVGGLYRNYKDKRNKDTPTQGWMVPKTKINAVKEYFKNKEGVTSSEGPAFVVAKKTGAKSSEEETTDFGFAETVEKVSKSKSVKSVPKDDESSEKSASKNAPSESSDSISKISKTVAKALANKWNDDFRNFTEKLMETIGRPETDDQSDSTEKIDPKKLEIVRILRLAFHSENILSGKNKNWKKLVLTNEEKKEEYVFREVLENNEDWIINSVFDLHSIENIEIRDINENDVEIVEEAFKRISEDKKIEEKHISSTLVLWKNNDLINFSSFKLKTCIIELYRNVSKFYYEI